MRDPQGGLGTKERRLLPALEYLRRQYGVIRQLRGSPETRLSR
jgi:hypothetical protein